MSTTRDGRGLQLCGQDTARAGSVQISISPTTWTITSAEAEAPLRGRSSTGSGGPFVRGSSRSMTMLVLPGLADGGHGATRRPDLLRHAVGGAGRSSLWSSGPGKRSDGLIRGLPASARAGAGLASPQHYPPRLARLGPTGGHREPALLGIVALRVLARSGSGGGCGEYLDGSPASIESPSRSDIGTRGGRGSGMRLLLLRDRPQPRDQDPVAELGEVVWALLAISRDLRDDRALAEQICRACVVGLDIDGAAISLRTPRPPFAKPCRHRRHRRPRRTLQYDLGEGSVHRGIPDRAPGVAYPT